MSFGRKMEDAIKCYEHFVKEGIWSDDERTFMSNFRKWALKNHPDKVPGNLEIFKSINNCKQMIDNFESYKSIVKRSAPTFTRSNTQVSPKFTRSNANSYKRSYNEPMNNHPQFGPRPQARNLADLKKFAEAVYKEAEVESKIQRSQGEKAKKVCIS